jgi:phosphate transport system substrate-binding protein
MRTNRTRYLAAAAAAFLFLGACGDDDDGGSSTGLSGEIRIDGSSTLTPLISLAAEDFQTENSGVRVTVGTSGTGGGFEKFCNGETDISMASRQIKESEVQACAANGIEPLELIVANDGLSVVVNPANDWADCLTVAQLKQVWEPGSTVKSWRELDPAFPDEPLTGNQLFGAGSDSGTFDYFTAAINGEEGSTRTDYNPSENDNDTINGVSKGSKGTMGYFGLSYLLENADKVKGVMIDGGSGCVAPSTETVQDRSYAPLGRELYVYLKAESAARPEVKAFADFYFENQGPLTEEALFVPLTDAQVSKAEEELAAIAAT